MDELTEEQEKAVYNEGHSLVLAGPGTGKTRVVTNKICKLIEDGVPENRIMATTFTKNAADQIRARVIRITGKGDYVNIGTLHSLFFGMVKENCELLDYDSPHLNVYTNDSTRRDLVRDLLKSLHYEELSSWVDDNKKMYGVLINKLSKLFLKQIDVHRLRTELNNPEVPKSKLFEVLSALSITDKKKCSQSIINIFSNVYKHYLFTLRYNRAIDFTGMLHFAYQVLRDNEGVTLQWQSEYDYVIVDEGQDLNEVQWQLVRFSSETAELTIVGDEKQCIYEWLHASPSFMQRFIKEYDPQIHSLTLNWRSQPPIVNLVNRIGKDVEKIEERELVPMRAETNCCVKQAQFSIAEEIKRVASHYGYNWKDFMICFRSKNLISETRRGLIEQGIPEKTNRGTQFFNLKEINSVLNYIKIVNNPHDDHLMSEILTDCHGIGKKKVSSLKENSSLPLFEQIKRLRGSKKHEKTMKNVVSIINDLPNKNDPINYLKTHASRYGICQEMVNKLKDTNKQEEAKANIDTLGELVKKYVPLSQENISNFMEDITGMEVTTGKNKDAVMVTTGHGTKGDEWCVTFVASVDYKMFPNHNSDNRQEELRLFYVCASRAMDRVYFTCSGRPSEFLNYL